MTALQPLARIWFTYKTRIFSERRYQRYAIVSHLALSWYAFLGIVFSIYQQNFSSSLGMAGVNQASLVISVLTFGLSLVIYGFRFEELARVHRDCYLRMQAIYQSSESDDAKTAKYISILDQYPNHSENDWNDLLFDSWKAGVKLIRTDGTEVDFSYAKITAAYLRRAGWLAFIATIFVLPIAIATYWGLGT